MKPALLIFAGLGALLASVEFASAQDVKIVGIGSTTCHVYEAEIGGNSADEKNYFAWAQGYMSGLLIRAPQGKDETLDLMPPTFVLEQQAKF